MHMKDATSSCYTINNTKPVNKKDPHGRLSIYRAGSLSIAILLHTLKKLKLKQQRPSQFTALTFSGRGSPCPFKGKEQGSLWALTDATDEMSCGNELRAQEKFTSTKRR